MSLGTNEHWPGFTAAESLQWSRTLLRHSPQPMSASIKAQLSHALSRGIPAVGADWVKTAEEARDCGFTAVLYHALFTSLKSIDRDSFAWHPYHRRVTHLNQAPGLPFEAALWKDWPQLVVDDGFAPGTATELVLLSAEATYRS